MSEPFALGLKNKKYGLLLPTTGVGKSQGAPAPTRSVLDLADDDLTVDLKEQFSQRNSSEQRKVKAMLEKAKAEDPTVFQYDEVVEQLPSRSDSFNRMGTKTSMAEQPKYIGGLLAQAAERKRKDEVLYEKRLIREREAEDRANLEGGLPTEQFVTDAYKKKLAENRKYEQEQKLLAELEARQNKGDLTDFYSNMFKGTNVATGPAKPATAPITAAGAAISVSLPSQADDSPSSGNFNAQPEIESVPSDSTATLAPDHPSGVSSTSNLVKMAYGWVQKIQEPDQAQIEAEKRQFEEKKDSAKERFLARKKAREAEVKPADPQ
jgi:coiled-coil domain-containing protein 55